MYMYMQFTNSPPSLSVDFIPLFLPSPPLLSNHLLSTPPYSLIPPHLLSHPPTHLTPFPPCTLSCSNFHPPLFTFSFPPLSHPFPNLPSSLLPPLSSLLPPSPPPLSSTHLPPSLLLTFHCIQSVLRNEVSHLLVPGGSSLPQLVVGRNHHNSLPDKPLEVAHLPVLRLSIHVGLWRGRGGGERRGRGGEAIVSGEEGGEGRGGEGRGGERMQWGRDEYMYINDRGGQAPPPTWSTM